MSGPPRKVLHLPKVRMLSRGARLAPGIRITNVKSIRPPNADEAKRQEEEKLRAQVQKEIVSRSRSCAYAGYECWAPPLAGRRHCAAHILADPAAPYVPCAGGGAAGCGRPAHAQDQRDGRDPLCFEHARAALLARQRSAAPPPPVASSEALLHQLRHYVKAERARTQSSASSVSVVSEPDPEPPEPEPADPFKQMDAPAINSNYSLSILECCSGSSSEAESVTLGPGGSCRHQLPDEDEEEAPVESGPLWRAGVFTAEEAVSETKTALRSLQSAYIQQMSRLKVLLQTARLRYLRTLKQEKEQYCSINSQARGGALTGRERRQLRKLKALAGYRRRAGAEAVLARKLHHKRGKCGEAGSSRPVPSPSRCTFSEGGVRCAGAVLPAAKHCAKHILLDRHQVLFVACGDARGLSPCREPAPAPLPRSCRYHADPPAYCVFTLKKDESASDTDTDTAVTDGSLAESLERPAADTLDTLEPALHALATREPAGATLEPTLSALAGYT